MPSTITLTTANVVQDGQNSSLVYNFPNSVQFKDHSITVSKISMYYAWTNAKESSDRKMIIIAFCINFIFNGDVYEHV